MKKISIILLTGLLSLTAFSQQEPVISNYLSERFIVNPAGVGISSATNINLFAKNYFLGFSDKNPGTQLLSLTTRKDYYGIGVLLMNDYFGNTRSTSLQLAYAYHMQVSDFGNISFSLAPGFRQFGINQSEYQYFDNDDPAISGSIENKLVFDADFGTAFYSDNFFIGIGIKNLLEPDVSLGGNISEENKILRNYTFTGDYKYSFSDDLAIQASTFFAINSVTGFYDINLRGYIKNLVWVGAGYKGTNSICASFGVDYNNIHFGYAFDHSFATISNYTNGTHEVIIGYTFGSTEPDSNPKM